jgi:hypothetical protein
MAIRVVTTMESRDAFRSTPVEFRNMLQARTLPVIDFFVVRAF